ncbi:CLUMA_CG017973, isoform A [Clunio marinus]|uniref:CLUMA_CG017973, isoform A n=1 Tax=Clunio marinus TaxID=568069 RepID=A0A1J1IY94_9DIPT|nr:CLUMA_CG017973, isoform A [Clunio marinus]
MSELSKKKMKQLRLPFEKLSATPQSDINSSPKLVVPSRKRKISTSQDNNEIIKLKIDEAIESKENFATEVKECLEESMDIIECSDDDDKELCETNPIQSNSPKDAPLHIILPSCSKYKKKIISEKHSKKSAEDDEDDDSVVYLDEELILSNWKKINHHKTRKSNEMKISVSDTENHNNDVISDGKLEYDHQDVPKITEEDKSMSENEMEVASEEQKDSGVKFNSEIINESKSFDQEEKKSFHTVPSSVLQAETLDPETIHDEIVDILSDNSDSLEYNKSSTEIGNDGKLVKTKSNTINLTPKQIARRQEQEARRLEKEAQRQKERELKEQQRLKEKEQREEAKRREKEEKEEARKKEKEERDRKRQAEQDKKDEEKRLKEEERKRIADQREEEKRQKEEERKRQNEMREEEKQKREEVQKKKEIEEQNRKKRAAEAFSKFFVLKKKSDSVNADDENALKDEKNVENGETLTVSKGNFMPFQVRERMKVAPCVRRQMDKKQLSELDKLLNSHQSVNELYLKTLKSGDHKPLRSSKTWPLIDKEEDDVLLIDELEGAGEDISINEVKMTMKYRSKYLRFAENRRPAYYGTWRKKSSNVSARRPFGKDTFFDYEIDSDEEWEEEEPGESIHGSESEKDKEEKEEEDDYEVDNDFFVPHGHLSDEEVDDGEIDNHPETQKAKLKILQQEFAAEMKKKTEKIKPRLIGCIWMNGDEDEHGCSRKGQDSEKKYHCSDIIWRILKAREMMTSEEGVKLEADLEPEIIEQDEEEVQKPLAPQKSQMSVKFTESSVKELIKLIHGNNNNKIFLIREFQAYRLKNYHKNADFQEYSMKTVEEKMMNIADYKTCPIEGAMFGKKCWLVKNEVLKEYFGDESPALPNDWSYILEKKSTKRKQKTQQQAEVVKESSPPKLETQKGKETSETSQPIIKKRVQLLMSVPRGQAFPSSVKNALMTQFINTKDESTDKNVEKLEEKNE